ncbi:hydrolase 1, exosortase A system-associated [Undibacterium sp. SXout20W]|uniref:hydrolase 1, exosortase A system-associated n=1 Tax=Undibacterium sp. SXout20W TaxID=3413051 RepID=UPI003BF32598
MTSAQERALIFECQNDYLTGIIHSPHETSSVGVVILVGGPQYRVGSHRQFILLARNLADCGITTFRFDYRGMGDSTGKPRNFDDTGTDIRSAIDTLIKAAPSIERVVLWGLCDGATAATFYSVQDPRVSGLVLANPWLRTEQTQAQTHLKHYFRQRLMQAEFWYKLFSKRSQFLSAIGSLIEQIRLSRVKTPSSVQLPDRVFASLAEFSGRVLILLSGNDLTAQEFSIAANSSPAWRKLLCQTRFTQHELPGADHTFSSRIWRDQVASWTSEWIVKSAN